MHAKAGHGKFSSPDLAFRETMRHRKRVATFPTNADIAVRLCRHAALLAARGENLYRVRAFRQAALAVMALETPVVELGTEALKQVRGIGESLAEMIGQYAKTGEWTARTL
jgi:Holliday junction DNA helicase RuvA